MLSTKVIKKSLHATNVKLFYTNTRIYMRKLIPLLILCQSCASLPFWVHEAEEVVEVIEMVEKEKASPHPQTNP